MANSVDPDQTPHVAASDLGLHCLQRLSIPILKINMIHTFQPLYPHNLVSIYFIQKEKLEAVQ